MTTLDQLRRRAAIPAVLAAAIALRIGWIGQYPHYHPDEGFWSNGARNHVLFGDAFMDARLHPYLSPGTYAALVGHFSLFAPTLVSARLFSALAGVAACVVVWLTGRRLFPRRPWLPLLIFSVCGFSVLMHRIMLLEAHQTFWLALAAALFLLPGSASSKRMTRGAMLLAGAAFGVALLVKSNSVYVAPAILAALPGPGADERATGEERSRASWWLMHAALFFGAAAVIGGGAYLLVRANDPTRFGWAFQYELESKHFLEDVRDPLLFHFGRLGFRPYRAASVTLELLKGDPLLVVLACVTIARTLRRPMSAPREDRLFAAWAVVGYLFDMVQINATHRYLGTLAPALAFLAARTLDRAFPEDAAAPRPLHRRYGMQAVFLTLLGHTVIRIGFGAFQQHPNREYWQTVDFIRANVPADASVMAASYISLSLPQRSYDYYRVLRAYDDEDHPRSLAAEVQRRNVTVIVRDDEWRETEPPEAAEFLATRCDRLAEIGHYEILQVRR